MKIGSGSALFDTDDRQNKRPRSCGSVCSALSTHRPTGKGPNI